MILLSEHHVKQVAVHNFLANMVMSVKTPIFIATCPLAIQYMNRKNEVLISDIR